MNPPRVMVSSDFADLNSKTLRFLQEASKLGRLHAVLRSDLAIVAATGKKPKFPEAERHYFLQASRYVQEVSISGPKLNADELPKLDFKPDTWVVTVESDTLQKRALCEKNGIAYHVVKESDLHGFPAPPAQPPTGRKKVVATGCYDWLHTGHIAFFEEVSQLGDLYLVLGTDANLRLLKGEGHPLFSQDERRYAVGSIRYVTQALIASGSGWMDAEPEILNIIKADKYVVNEDGDKPEKREFCARHGIEYIVLKRIPKTGLAGRSSTDLRGF